MNCTGYSIGYKQVPNNTEPVTVTDSSLSESKGHPQHRQPVPGDPPPEKN